MKRKFSSKRLYKLLKTIIIIVSVLSLIIGTFNLWTFGKNGPGYLERGLAQCQESFNTDSHLSCSVYVWEFYNNWKRKGNIFTGLGIILPIVFYGGTRLFKYLFPEEPKNSKSPKEL